ncbi:hypothetical protein ACFQL0_14960 [Haloplanus litoreus]
MDESELEEELRNFGIDVHDVEAVDPIELSCVTAYPGRRSTTWRWGVC